MPAPLSEARMKEIARVVAASPTMDVAAAALGYKSRNVLSVRIANNGVLREMVRKARTKAKRPTWERRGERIA